MVRCLENGSAYFHKNAGSSAPRLDRRRQFSGTEAWAQELPYMTIKVKTQIRKIRKSAFLAGAALALPCSALANPPQQPAAPAAAAPANPATGTPNTQKPDRSAAYYHFGLAHMYEDMATNYGRPEYAPRAIEEYKLALDADPGSKHLNTGLAG